jgi:ubiquinone/menaquinone biosynthesis C-methylase UbiE
MEYTTIKRKQQETAHYNSLAKQWQQVDDNDKWQTDAHQLRHDDYLSYIYLDKLLAKFSQGKKVLDYGCGTGIHSLTPLRIGAKEVVGIDLSEESLKIARERAKKEKLADQTRFIKMDCEKLEFDDNSFDIILDGGTFSSLDLDKALPELARVLKPFGKLIGIETLGHNPIFNLKRKWNVARGTRTKWAADHIFKVDDFTRVKKYFNQIQVKYFHLTVLFALPLRKIPGTPFIIKLLDKIDSILLKIPLLQKYAFKVVFVFSEPKKN